jgi:hypothetical protein
MHRVYNTECQAFCPIVVRIGSPRKRVLHPLGVQGGDTLACGGEGVEGPNSEERTDTVVLSDMYNCT